jgi:hypothetical protein
LEEIATLGDSALLLPAATKLPKLDHIPDGHIIVIRFIRSDRQLDIFSEKFKVPKELVYTYVKAIIDTSNHSLAVYLGDDFVMSFEYRLPSGEGESLARVNDHLKQFTINGGSTIT